MADAVLMVGGVQFVYTPDPETFDLTGGEHATEETTLIDGSTAVSISEKPGAYRLRVPRTPGQVVSAGERAALLGQRGMRVSVGVYSHGVSLAEAVHMAGPRFWPVLGSGGQLWEYELEILG